LHSLRQPKIENLHRVVVRHLHVCGFQIAVDDPALVRVFERLGNLLGDPQSFINRNRPLFDAVGESRPFDQLHDERMRGPGIFESVD
jgi:hypothetical protein